jgi:hypothetical protein
METTQLIRTVTVNSTCANQPVKEICLSLPLSAHDGHGIKTDFYEMVSFL